MNDPDLQLRTHLSKNLQPVGWGDVPVLRYGEFYPLAAELLAGEHRHCLNYFAFPLRQKLRFLCVIADDESGEIFLLSHETEQPLYYKLRSLAQSHFAVYPFEWQIHRQYGISFAGHPWTDPVPYPVGHENGLVRREEFSLYHIESAELNAAGGGPLHLGLSESGRLRFLRYADQVLNLPVQAHRPPRDTERLLLKTQVLEDRCKVAEEVADGAVIAHSLAFVQAMESLTDTVPSARLRIERSIALELERMSEHAADLYALHEAQRNAAASNGQAPHHFPAEFFRSWCRERSGRGLIRPGGTHFPLSRPLIELLRSTLDRFEEGMEALAPGERYKGLGRLSPELAQCTEVVGPPARASGQQRDIRYSHPFGAYEDFEPIIRKEGDIPARYALRFEEIRQSLALIRGWLRSEALHEKPHAPVAEAKMRVLPHQIVTSLVEGARGEICHTLVTDSGGNLHHIKITAPALHNWTGLALSLSGLRQTEYPVNTRSFNMGF